MHRATGQSLKYIQLAYSWPQSNVGPLPYTPFPLSLRLTVSSIFRERQIKVLATMLGAILKKRVLTITISKSPNYIYISLL